MCDRARLHSEQRVIHPDGIRCYADLHAEFACETYSASVKYLIRTLHSDGGIKSCSHTCIREIRLCLCVCAHATTVMNVNGTCAPNIDQNKE